MLIAAFSDLDPIDFGQISWEEFEQAVKKAKKPDLLLLAGDMYDHRNPKRYVKLLKLFDKVGWNCPIVAVFGNHELEEEEKTIKELCKDRITFLDDESIILDIAGKKVGIVGSEGCMDLPSYWQIDGVLAETDPFTHRRERLGELAKELKEKADIAILLTHFAPTYSTLKREYVDNAVLGSNQMGPILENVDFAVHGHSHFGIEKAKSHGKNIFNVSFLVNKKIVEIDTGKLMRK